ncbi:MAG TPA: ABC transporter substrate-binding protein [Stellaceae bacterium]|nr:ABC transporter substrate-binding protein [Stellaceae bacterium]
MTHLVPFGRTLSRAQRCHVVYAAAAIVLGAAGGATAADAASTPSTASMPHLTLSYSEKTADMMPLWIASDAGYFKQHGLDVTERYLPAQEGVPALLTGQVQAAGIGGPDAISAVAQGAKLKFVMTLSPVYTFQFWVRPQFASANALKGQRVGVPSTTGSLFAATVLTLGQLGLSTRDVAITPLGSVPNVNNALLAGSIAAAASHPPATYQFQRNGFVDLVDLTKKRLPSVSAGVLFTTAYIQSHPQVVQGVVAAVMQGFQREKTDRAYVESEMRDHLGVKDKAVLDFTYDFYVNQVIPTAPLPQIAQVEAAQKAMGATNPKVRAVDISTMIDQSFVRKAEK